MHIRCPHCHSPIEIVDDSSFTEINCPSCGSSFSLISGDTTETHRTGTRRLAHFELVRELGIGKFGSVWMARDTKLDRTVAVKIPRKGALDAQETEMFLRDARAAAQLKHPNIVGVHEVGREGETVYIVSDYVEGANLKEWLSGRHLSFRESAGLVAKVAEALEHAHQSGVVHRDVKPGNIMLDRDGQPHVIDFGLAKREAGEITMTVDGHILGTPAYMSPEQAKGKGHDADRRSDVYSLGVILFELMTGELPFRGETHILLLQIKDDEPPRPRRLNARIPRDLETITLKCLEKEPARRYQTAQALADDLRRWLDGHHIAARPVRRVERLWRWTRRNPVVAVLSVTVLCLGAVLPVLFHRANLGAATEGELSPDEVAILDQRVRSFQQQFDKIHLLYRVGSKGGEANLHATAGYELDAASAVLAWAKGDTSGALSHMEKACEFAGVAVEATRAAYEAEAVTLDQLTSAIEEDAMARLALGRLKRSLAGERTNWFRIAMSTYHRSGAYDPIVLMEPNTPVEPIMPIPAQYVVDGVGTPIAIDETPILAERVQNLESVFKRVQTRYDARRSGGEPENYFQAGYRLFAAKADLAAWKQNFEQALTDQRKAIEFTENWLHAAREAFDAEFISQQALNLAERSHNDAMSKVKQLEKWMKDPSARGSRSTSAVLKKFDTDPPDAPHLIDTVPAQLPEASAEIQGLDAHRRRPQP